MTNDSNLPVAPVPEQAETDKLKAKFMARSIPLQQDFHDLIDMADAGRLAAGLSPAQGGTKNTAKTGLIIGNDKRLAVKAKTDGGLDVATDGVSVKKGNGIEIDAEGVSVKIKSGRGIVVTPDGIGIELVDPLAFNSEGEVVIQDRFVTKSGDSSVAEGDICFATEGHGIRFPGDGRFVKVKDVGLAILPGHPPHKPVIYDHTGLNPSPIATEAWVSTQIRPSVSYDQLREVVIVLVGMFEVVTMFAAGFNADQRNDLQTMINLLGGLVK